MRRLLGGMLQGVVDAEAAAHIGAQLHERSDLRTTQRNGTRDKLVTTAAGDLTVKIPKVRTGSFFPALLCPRRRIDVALHAVVMQAYVEGVSTRRVDDLVVAMGGTGISKSEVSRICAQLDTEVALWRTRTLDHIAFPYVFLFVDATYCKVRLNHRVVSQAVVIATGVSADGRREVLGCATGASETEDFLERHREQRRTRRPATPAEPPRQPIAIKTHALLADPGLSGPGFITKPWLTQCPGRWEFARASGDPRGSQHMGVTREDAHHNRAGHDHGGCLGRWHNGGRWIT